MKLCPRCQERMQEIYIPDFGNDYLCPCYGLALAHALNAGTVEIFEQQERKRSLGKYYELMAVA